LGMVLDEPKIDDYVLEQDDLKMVINQKLLKACGSVNIDYKDYGWQSGFTITTSNQSGCGNECRS